MELYNGQIPVGRLLADPRARALIDREFPGLLQNPVVKMARRMPLQKVLQRANGFVEPEKLARVLQELKEL